MNVTSPTCKFLRSYTGIWQGSAEGFFFPPPPPSSLFALISALRNAIDQEILRDYHPPLFPLTGCMLLKFYPVCLSGLLFYWPQGLALHHLLYQTSSPWLCFISSSHVILLAHNYQPSWRLETLWKFLPPIFQPWRIAFVCFFLPVGGVERKEELIKDERKTCRNEAQIAHTRAVRLITFLQ